MFGVNVNTHAFHYSTEIWREKKIFGLTYQKRNKSEINVMWRLFHVGSRFFTNDSKFGNHNQIKNTRHLFRFPVWKKENSLTKQSEKKQFNRHPSVSNWSVNPSPSPYFNSKKWMGNISAILMENRFSNWKNDRWKIFNNFAGKIQLSKIIFVN